MNPVALEAQASVPVPEGLDLETWIVPRAMPAIAEVSETGFKKKKDKKGKGKSEAADEAGGTKKSGKKKKKNKEIVLTEEELAEAEERAKVCVKLGNNRKLTYKCRPRLVVWRCCVMTHIISLMIGRSLDQK